MSFPLRDLSSRRSSGSPKPEAEHENHHAQDTAGLTGEAPENTRLTKKQSFLTRIFSDTWTVTRNDFTEVLAIATFYGTYTGNNPDHPTQVHDSTSDAARAFGDIFYNKPSPEHIAAIRPLLTNLETAMSNALRTSSNIPATAPGTANYNEI